MSSIVSVTLLALLGLGIVAGVFNAKRLVAWENSVMSSLADSVRAHRLSMEEDLRLMEGAQPRQQALSTQAEKPAARRGSKAA